MQAESLFDVPPSEMSAREWDVELPYEDRDWSVGLIVGPSGSGKSTLASALWPEARVVGFEWPEDKSVLDAFSPFVGIKEITGLLTAVGFGSPPSWLRPFRMLSTGEQFRVSAARALADNPGFCVIDEFTSVVDRQVAQVASHAIQKTVRRRGGKLVAVTCHYDVADWLQPDWVYQPHADEFTWRELQPRPSLQLDIYPVGREAWRLFRQHHYLSADLSVSAVCFGGFIGDECVGFTSYMHFPHADVRDIKMGHRLVVLPDWQGLGIGGKMDDWLGQWLYERGYRYHNVVAHPAMVAYYAKSPRWKRIGAPKRQLSNSSRDRSLRARNTAPRSLQVHSFAYVPPMGKS